MSMTAGVAEPSPPLSITAMAIPDVEYIVPPPGAEEDMHSPSTPRTFRKHKNLPRPRHASGSTNGSCGTPESRRSSSGSGSQSLHTLRHQRRRLSGGELPPTPPAHSRTSSSTKSVSSSNISPLHTPAQSYEDVQTQASPSTPLNQRSPPTPEVTPPRAGAPSKSDPERPVLPHCRTSKSTTAGSRTESFRTALESPESSEQDEEDSNTTLRRIPSARSSDLTVRRSYGDETHTAYGAVLGPGTKSRHGDETHDLTPRASKSAFHSFDGDWGAESEVEQQWDDNLARSVTVKKRRHRSPRPQSQQIRHEIVDDRTVLPTNATRAVRGLPLQGRILTYDLSDPVRNCTAPETAVTDAPVKSDDRRLSGMSTRSTASTTVEAILVGTPPPARRNRTLRHVKRVDALRDASWQSPPPGPVRKAESPPSRTRRVIQPRDAPRESYASNSTVNPVSSRKARKDSIKTGAIPVVVVPDRHSSTRSTSQDRSVPSTDSQLSKRSQSIKSVPLSQVPKTHDLTPYFERPSRRSRRTSESDGSLPGDQRTMDFPPVVPQRSSSLSAPTSRSGSRRTSVNGSHSGSLTAESLKALNDSVVAHNAARAPNYVVAGAVSSPTEVSMPSATIESVPSYNQFKFNTNKSEAVDHQPRVESVLGSPHLATENTPFSTISIETSGTAAEISQAMAMSIDRHQNRSVLMVDHRPSESSDGERRSGRPAIITTDANGLSNSSREIASSDEPITPPQEQPPFSLNDLESPLRHPRAPPEPPQPPVLEFTAATPSGLTPSDERPRLLGNFYDEVDDEKPSQGFAKVRRALNKRRNSYGPSPNRQRPGFLTRTLSLTRNIRKETVEIPGAVDFGQGNYDEPNYDDSHLHPDWQPSYYPGGHGHGDFDMEDDGEGEQLRYPMIDNRPRQPKRSLSQRMKNTFAIMPTRDFYIHDNEPERRIIRRDSSGGLRVVKKRGSVGSLREPKSRRRAPNTEPQRTPVFPRKFNLAKLRRRGSEDSEMSVGSTDSNGLRRTWSLTQVTQGLSRRLSERRREKRSMELRSKISAPKDCRDGVEDLIRRDGGMREAYEHPTRQVERV